MNFLLYTIHRMTEKIDTQIDQRRWALSTAVEEGAANMQSILIKPVGSLNQAPTFISVFDSVKWSSLPALSWWHPGEVAVIPWTPQGSGVAIKKRWGWELGGRSGNDRQEEFRSLTIMFGDRVAGRPVCLEQKWGHGGSVFGNVLNLRRWLAAANVGLDQGSQRREAGEG